MIISNKKLLFVHIQKTAGEAICTALDAPTNSPTKHWKAAELVETYSPEIWNSHTRFAFVRNPWDRLVSWWSMIDARRAIMHQPGSVNNFMRYILTTAVTFDDFVTHCSAEIEDFDGKKCVHHNQIDYIVGINRNIIVNFVGRFENLEDDLNALLSMTGNGTVDIPKINASKHRHYREYYSTETAELVGRIYAPDIKAFGYSF